MPYSNKSKLADIFNKLDKAVNQAKIDAINNVARGVYEKTVDLLSKDMGVDPELLGINKETGKQRAIRLFRADKSYPVASIHVARFRFTLYQMGGQWKRSDSGASYISGMGRRKTIPGSFIARIRTGSPSIYIRVNKHQNKDFPHGFPVRKLYGPDIRKVFMKRYIQKELKAYVRDNIKKEFGRGFKLEVNRHK